MSYQNLAIQVGASGAVAYGAQTLLKLCARTPQEVAMAAAFGSGVSSFIGMHPEYMRGYSLGGYATAGIAAEIFYLYRKDGFDISKFGKDILKQENLMCLGVAVAADYIADTYVVPQLSAMMM